MTHGFTHAYQLSPTPLILPVVDWTQNGVYFACTQKKSRYTDANFTGRDHTGDKKIESGKR